MTSVCFCADLKRPVIRTLLTYKNTNIIDAIKQQFAFRSTFIFRDNNTLTFRKYVVFCYIVVLLLYVGFFRRESNGVYNAC